MACSSVMQGGSELQCCLCRHLRPFLSWLDSPASLCLSARAPSFTGRPASICSGDFGAGCSAQTLGILGTPFSIWTQSKRIHFLLGYVLAEAGRAAVVGCTLLVQTSVIQGKAGVAIVIGSRNASIAEHDTAWCLMTVSQGPDVHGPRAGSALLSSPDAEATVRAQPIGA